MKNERCVGGVLLTGVLVFVSLAGVYGQGAGGITAEGRYQSYLNFYTLVGGRNVHPHWVGDGDRFWFAGSRGDSPVRYWVDPVRNTQTELSGLADNGLREGVSHASALYAPDRRAFVFVRDDNIWLESSDSSKLVSLTNDGTRDDSWTIPAAAWSPDGGFLLVQESDVRRVHHLPVIDYSKPVESVQWTAYAKTGGALEVTGLFVADVKTGGRIKIDMGLDTAQYIFPLGWRGDGSAVYFMRLSREGKKLELLAGDRHTGAGRVILVEQQATFVGGLDFIMEKWKGQCTFLNDGKGFIWLSERDGWRHLYLYGMDGKLIRRLTEGAFPVVEVLRADEKTGWVYFMANGERNLYATNLYRVRLDGTGFGRLTGAGGSDAGSHTIQFSPTGHFFLDTYSAPDRLPVVELRRAGGGLLRVLQRADTSRLSRIGFRVPESFVVKAADDSTDLYGILYKPVDFDPGKKYPVIECIYGGPFMTIVPGGFMPGTSLAIQAQAMAQLGYITFLVDGRGTTGRSKAFQDVVYGHIGEYEIADHVAALKQLAAGRPYMDLSRVGIYGHSWGGYFALRAMLTAPDIYRVGIVSAPGDLMEGAEINEPYMGLPSDNRAGYAFGSNTDLAGNLRGKLLFIHGTSDTNAPLSVTVRMIDALIRAGKRYDLLLLPGQGHFFEGVSEKYMNEEVRGYFEGNLKTAGNGFTQH